MRILSESPRLRTIARRLIATGFPELRRVRLAIGFRQLDPDECLRYDYSRAGYSVSVGEFLRGAPRRVLEGGIAHELSHIVQDSRVGPAQRDRAYEIYARSAAYRIRDERATEIRQIERGYGEQLLAFLRYAKQAGYTFTRENGLSRGELAIRLRSVRNRGQARRDPDFCARGPWSGR